MVNGFTSKVEDLPQAGLPQTIVAYPSERITREYTKAGRYQLYRPPESAYCFSRYIVNAVNGPSPEKV
jgi:hypothetical protein